MRMHSHNWMTCSALLITALLCAPRAAKAAPAGRTVLRPIVCPQSTKKVSLRQPAGSVTFCAGATADGKQLRHGPFRRLYPNAQLRETGQYRRGAKAGLWRRWHENGNRRSVYQVQAGQLHGRFVQWYSNGIKAQQGHYRRGRRIGCWTTWQPSGTIRESYCYKDTKTAVVPKKRKRPGKNMMGAGLGITLTLVMLPVGVPLAVCGAVRYKINDPALTPAAREKVRMRYLYAGLAVTAVGFAAAGIGGGLLAAPAKCEGCFIAAVTALPVGLFTALLIGLPMVAEAAAWAPKSKPKTAHRDPDTHHLDHRTGQHPLDPGHERVFQRQLHAGQPQPTMFTARLHF